MIVVKHGDDDAEEPADFGRTTIIYSRSAGSRVIGRTRGLA
jgi:hypothetical protein